ncbi:uncharacterized protein V6R79_020518 [Siganus canaliculatus]
MAHAGVVLDKDQFNCSICLDVLKEPVTIPCGHSYCSICIKNYWDQDDYLGVFVCPQCRQSFSPRPPLARNTMLADVVDRFKKTGLQDAPAPSNHSLAEADDVECDVCSGRKCKAVKSCLVCLASYCDVHVQPHYESAAFKKHKLVTASKNLQNTICRRHDKLLEVYCRTDQRCICYLCLTDEHKGHDTVLVEAEIQHKQREQRDMKQMSQQRILQREKEAQELKQAIFYLIRSAREAAAESDAIFTELIRAIELKRFEVRELINAQEKMASSQAEQLLEKIQKEITELKMNEAELDKLSHAEDHILFLQGCQSLQAPPLLSALPTVTADPKLNFGPVLTAVSDFKGLLQEVCQEGFVCIYERVRDVVIVGQTPPAAQPETTPSGDGQPSLHMEPAAVAETPIGLDHGPVNPLNPFLPATSTAPNFAFSCGKLKEKLCPQHNKLAKLYCRTDQHYVCSLCVKERHRGHDAVPLEDERAAQQKKLQETSLKSLHRLKDVEKELRYVVRYIKHSTEAAVEESERIFSKLIRCMEKQSCEVMELIRVQERAAVSQAEELLEKIQREIVELRRTDAELEKLSHNEDHIHFLQSCKSLHFPTRTVEMPNADALQYLNYKSMREALAHLKDSLDETLEKEFSRISEKVISLKETSNRNVSEKTKARDPVIPYDSQPKTRPDFLHYYHDIALDLNTANPYLSFTDRQRGVTTRSEPQPYPDHPSRFTSWAQVLCRAGMAGRCYWEVEWAGEGGVSVGVCYKSMSRSGGGSECKLGHNAKSWSLDCSYAACLFHHNKESVAVTAPCSSRIGIYLDFRGGTLSFYNVSDSMVLLHKVKTTFSQPVYPGFWVGLGSFLKICAP